MPCPPAPLTQPLIPTWAVGLLHGHTDDDHSHGLRTPNEGINRRNLKVLADVTDKICSDCTWDWIFGRAVHCSEGDFLTGRS